MDWKEELTRLYGWECLSREEVLSHMKRDFMDYPWSLITLCRRLRYFGIQKNDRRITIQEAMDAVSEELVGPGQLLGYRAMHQRLKHTRGLNVPRDLVYAVMSDLDFPPFLSVLLLFIAFMYSDQLVSFSFSVLSPSM